MLLPENQTVPAVGSITPVIRLKVVLFLAPFGPIRAKIIPELTSKLTLSTAVSPPNFLVSARTESKGVPFAGRDRDGRDESTNTVPSGPRRRPRRCRIASGTSPCGEY